MNDSAHNIYWNNSLVLNPVHKLSGYSRCAENTGFFCKELDMAFDAGIQMNPKPAYICLSHLHNDHMCAINKLLIDNSKNPIIFIPDNDKFEFLLRETLKLIFLSSKCIHPSSDKAKEPDFKYPYRIVRLKVGQTYKLDNESQTGLGYYVEGLPSSHGVISISFGLFHMRNRCKKEYQSLQKKDYAKLRKDGIEFMESYRKNLFCYMSDTNQEPFTGSDNNLIFAYDTIIVECTFLEECDLAHAKKKSHMHWNHLQKIIKNHPEHKFILIHFSKKYSWAEIKEFFDKIHAKTPLNITIWLHPTPHTYTNDIVKEI